MYRDADFSADLTTVCVGQEVSFTDESTSDLIYNLEEAVTWSWDFGDGSTSLLQNPTHSYAADGIYTVSLTITDVSGCSSVETLEITVTPPLDVDVVHTDVTCFGLNDGTATATTVSGTGPYTYLWDDALSQAVSTAVD
jgi:PKD repeat protein